MISPKLVIGLQVFAVVIALWGVWYELRETFGLGRSRGETLDERRKRLGLPPLPRK